MIYIFKNKKRKEFTLKIWKKRILLGVGIGVIALLALSGIAFAAYNFWQGQANVTVLEGMTVTKIGDTGGVWDGNTNTWTISALKAGESRSITFNVANTATSGSVIVTPVVSPPSWAGFTLAWTGAIYPGGTTMNAGDVKDSTLTITALGDITPGSYAFTITYNRQ
jgi:hypothetical protein